MATTIPQNRARFTIWELLAATGGIASRVPDEHLEIVGLVTDSRTVTRSSGFVALRGDTFDGHEFLASAVEHGAGALVVERGRSVPPGSAAVVEVDDTRAALGLLARAHLRRWRRGSSSGARRRVAAITGSAGKTTTKELTAAILGAVGRCHATSGNLNNLVGVPAVALAIEDEACAVFELGMSVPGEIAALRRIVEPDVAALLNVGVAHASSFGGSRALVAREKGAIFEGLGADGIAVVGFDDDAARGQLVRCSEAKHVGFGTLPDADVRLVHREPVGTDGARVTLARSADSFDVYLPATGAAAALDLAAAVAIADATHGQPIAPSLIAASVRGWRPVTGRCVVTELVGDVLVIDDSYNANPGSMSAALATLMELGSRRSGRAIAVLGSMRELGPISAQAHVTLGHELARRGVAIAVGCGGEIDATLGAAREGGVQTHPLGDAVEAGAWLVSEVRPGDVVLFKGSRAAGVERALLGLLERRPAIVRAGSQGT